MIEKIKNKVLKCLKTKVIDFKEMPNPSKNEIYLVSNSYKKFILKIYKFRDDKENINSYNRERKAINYFSSQLDEVKPLISSGDGDNPWILMNFFEGSTLKSKKNFELYKKAVDLMLKLHFLEKKKEKPKEIEIFEPYDKKLQEVKQRVKKYLPKKYDKKFLISIVDNFYLGYSYIYDNSSNLIHGDFVDRNILVNGELNIIDFENSRVAPLVEDLIFFIENSKLDDIQKKELINKYKNKINFDQKIFLILTLLTKLRVLGSLLRIKKNNLEKFEDRIINSIKAIISLVLELKNDYNLDLTKKHKEDWEEIFSLKGKFFNEIHNELESFIESLNRETKILDLGSGSGRHIVFLADKGFDVTGIDFAKKGIEITKKILEEKELDAKLICHDFYDELPFEDNTFDCIVSTQAIHHTRVYEAQKLIKEIKRVLKTEGKIFITVPKIKDIFHKEPLEIEKNTFISTKGHERGIVHHYFNIPEIKQMFSDFEIEIKEDDYKHYLIIGHIVKTRPKVTSG